MLQMLPVEQQNVSGSLDIHGIRLELVRYVFDDQAKEMTTAPLYDVTARRGGVR